MNILAIDPGKTFGMAGLYKDSTIWMCTYRFPEQSFDVLENIRGVGIVIVERPFFNITVDTVVFEALGAVKFACNTEGAKLIIQEPSVITFINSRYPNLIKKLKGRVIHEKDACCHLVYYMIHNSYTYEDIESYICLK